MKKPAGSGRFWFYKQKTEKTEPNRTETDKKPEKKPSQNRAKPEKPSQTEKTEKTEPKPEKPSQTGLNRFCPKKPNRTETGRFDPVSVFFFKKKNIGLVIFFDKNRTEPKMITPSFLQASLIIRKAVHG